MRKKERENSDRIARVKNLLPDDLKALVVSLDASRYVSAGAPAGQAAELVEWANAKQRIRQLDMVLDRLEQDNSPRKPDADPTRYLEELRLLTGYIDIRGLQVSTEKAHRFPIEELFIPLTTGISEEQDLMTGTGRMEAAGSSPRNLHEALRSRTLVIIGDPGAGKSTFLKYVAKTLCDAWLDGKDENLASRLGFTERLFPILIDVAVLTEHVSTCRARQEGPSLGPQSPDWIPHYLGCSARARKWELDEAWFHARLIGYEALVMLDGLDEAASEATRNEIGEMVRGAARAYPRCRFVITSRPAAYIGTSIVPDFDHAWIEPLPDASIKSFIGHWCAALFHYDTEQAEKHQRELVAALCSRPAIRRLARNPVMLTALAVVHWNEKRLPEQRAALYQSIIKWLARSREHKKGRLSDTRILELLQKLALAMQDAQPSRRVQVPRRWAAERLAPNWPDKMEDQRIARADFFLAAEEVDSGIIVSRGIELRFWHLTFQEYLAARALAAFGEKRQNEVLLWHPGNLHASEWREVVLLFAGILCDQGREKVDGMVSSVLDRLDAKTPLVEKARVAGLPGEIVRDLAPFQFRPADVRYKELLDEVMVIFDCERSVPVPTSDAVAAAEALGLSGDPRFAGGRPVDPWVRIPAGEFIMGAQRHDPHGVGYDSEAADNEGPVHTVRLDGYAIGRYPVTVREYQEFVESAEYADARWWPSSGKPRWDAPTYWDGQKEYPTRPVIGVSWFEAAAFASWRGCRLPTEAEWERSARGREGRRFPWGDGAPNEQLLNFNQSRGHPTPVGVYPRGATPEGALDMAGNVWEWCVQGTGASTVDPQTFPTGSKTETARRVVRGGGFYDYAGWCRSACRRWSEPGLRLGDLGFRLAAGRGTGTSKQKRLRRAGARPSIRNLARIEPT